jgi:hypothetical protein
LVWKLDRWGRSVAHCVRSIQELVSLGIRFLAATQNIDTDESNPTSQFILHIFAAVAELEREITADLFIVPVGAATAILRTESIAPKSWHGKPSVARFGKSCGGG